MSCIERDSWKFNYNLELCTMNNEETICYRNKGLDMLKLLCAFMVILFHAKPIYREWTQGISNCAVPCFFMISGYCLFSERLSARCLKSAKRTIIILLWSTCFYIPLLFFAIYTGKVELPNYDEMFFNFILLNDNPASSHLWYCAAYVYVLLIVVFLNNHNKLVLLYIFLPALWMFDIIGGIYEVKTIFLRNFLFTGIPCFSVGMLIKKYELEHIFSVKILLSIIVLMCVLCNIETRLYESTHQTISTSLLSIPLLLLFLSTDDSHYKGIWKWFRENDSLYIYIFHPAVLLILSQVNKLLPSVWQDSIYPYISPIIVFLLTYLLIHFCYKVRSVLK